MANKITHAASPHVSEVVAEIEKQRKAAELRHAPRGDGGPNMIPVQSMKKAKPLPPHLRSPDVPVNADAAYDDLPMHDDILVNGKPARNIRYKSSNSGNVIVKG